MPDPLIEFLRAAAGRPFSFDACGRLTAAWVEQRLGIDPGSDWWGRYTTPLGLARLVKRRGGMVAHFDACLTAIGLIRIPNPKRGDIAIVEALEGPKGVILMGGGLCASVLPGRIQCRSLPILAAWSI